MGNKKFKLNSNLRQNLEILDSELSQKVIGGMRFPDDLIQSDPGCGAQCEITCANWCREFCVGLSC